MSFSLTPKQWSQIETFQASELSTIISDRHFARAMSVKPHFSEIGWWLSGPRGSINKRALEVGCGPGRYVAFLASLGYEVFGVDPHAYPTWTQLERSCAQLQSGVYAEDLPFEDGFFDAVACMGALLYYNNPQAAINEIHRVLTNNGKVIVRTVNKLNCYKLIRREHLDPATKNVYTEADLRQILERSGFQVVRTSSYGFYPPFLAGWWWWMVNGRLPIYIQELISACCPSRYRINVNAYAVKATDGK
jgi:SAM-dependent methyltransferase